MIVLELVMALFGISLGCVGIVIVFLLFIGWVEDRASARGFAETYLLDRDQHFDEHRDAMQGKRAG